MPPRSVTRLGPVASSSAGSTVCRTSVQLPAEPMLKAYSPARTAPGSKRKVCEPGAAPSTSAEQTAADACTQVRCWRIRPGFARLARMRVITMPRPVHMASASAVRRICPPPSPVEPSSSIGSMFFLFISHADAPGAMAPPAFHPLPGGPEHSGVATAHPFTHTTCFKVCTTSTRSFCAAITASMSL